MSREADLQERVEELEMAFEEMTRVPDAMMEVGALKLTATEGRMLGALLHNHGRLVTREAMLQALYYDRAGEWPEIKIIDVYLCKLRKRLAEAGVGGTISTIRGRGYIAEGFDVSELRNRPTIASDNLVRLIDKSLAVIEQTLARQPMPIRAQMRRYVASAFEE